MKSLTVLVAPMSAIGHVMATIGIAEALKDRGHKVVYVVDISLKGQLKKYGFIEEILYDTNGYKNENGNNGNMQPGEEMATVLKKSGILSDVSPLEKMKMLSNKEILVKMLDKKIEEEPYVKAVVEKHNPDIILIDDFFGLPCLIYSNIPWVNICSANPLFYIGGDTLPPAMSGFATNGDKNGWNEFRKAKEEMNKVWLDLYNEWMTKINLPALETTHMCIPTSPYLNIYGFPEELDYTDIRPIPKKWLRVDSFIRRDEEEFELPEVLKNRREDEKLIYLALGSMVSIDVDLMKRLVGILANSPHKVIVSKGLLGDKYELPSNMWGQKSVPQTRVLPLVDLVITHGGNNSVTEAFTFGKPMIVLPFNGDQFDNAQRLQEKGFGVRLEPYSCSQKDLLDSIDRLLNDNQMKNRLEAAKQRIADSKSIEKAVQIIESLAK